MTTITLFLIFIPLLALVLLLLNVLFAPHNPYQEKDSPFECGYHSFLGQNRTQFNIAFYIFGLCFLVFDLEILLLYPYAVSMYINNIYGLAIAIFFVLIVTIGLAYELGKNVLNINSRQDNIVNLVKKIQFNFYDNKKQIKINYLNKSHVYLNDLEKVKDLVFKNKTEIESIGGLLLEYKKHNENLISKNNEKLN